MIYVDFFTYTFADQPWIANQWLSEVLMALIDRLAGFDGLVLVTAAALAAMLAWIGNRLVASGLHWLCTLLVLALVFTGSAYSFHVRPHITTMILSAVLLGKLCDFEQDRIDARKLWWLIPWFILWTNLHGGVLGGLGTLLVAVLGWTLWWCLGLKSPITNRLVALILFTVMVACASSTLVNPYGISMYTAWSTILNADLPDLVIEHAPLDATKPTGQIVLIMGIAYLALIISTGRRMPHVTWLIPIVWFFLAVKRIRHGPLFAISAAIVLADILPHSRFAIWLGRRGFFDSGDSPEKPTNAAALGLWTLALIPALLFGLACVNHLSSTNSENRDVWAKPHPSVWPEEFVTVVNEASRSAPTGSRIFNEQQFGGFLIYNAPKLKIFIDGRCELFGDEFLRRYIQSRDDHQIINQWEHEFGFEFALTQTGSPIDRYFAEANTWNRLKETPSATLYRRSSE